MGKQVAKSKGNLARRAMQRNKGLPGGIINSGRYNTLANMHDLVSNSPTLAEMNRRLRMLRRWKVVLVNHKKPDTDAGVGDDSES